MNQRETKICFYVYEGAFSKIIQETMGKCWILLAVVTYSSHLDCFKLVFVGWISHLKIMVV